MEVEYPVGHRRRRTEGIPLLVEKFRINAKTCFSAERVEKIVVCFQDLKRLDQMTASDFIEQFTLND